MAVIKYSIFNPGYNVANDIFEDRMEREMETFERKMINVLDGSATDPFSVKGRSVFN